MSILPIVSSVPKVRDSSFVTNVVIFRWIYGIFSKIIVPIYIPNMIPITQRTVFFSVLIGGCFDFENKNIKYVVMNPTFYSLLLHRLNTKAYEYNYIRN